MAVQRNIAYLLIVVLCLANIVHASSMNKHRTAYYDNDLTDKVATGMSDYTNKLILRLIDAVIEDARDRGATASDLDDMMRKRSGIRKCFFHAVNCW